MLRAAAEGEKYRQDGDGTDAEPEHSRPVLASFPTLSGDRRVDPFCLA